MSKKQQALLLSAPLFPDSHQKEQHVFNGFTCVTCQGNGYTWTVDEFRDRIKKPCHVCEGKGLLKAVVTTVWQPDNI